MPSIAHTTAAGAIAEVDSDGDEFEEERSSDLDKETSEGPAGVLLPAGASPETRQVRPFVARVHHILHVAA